MRCVIVAPSHCCCLPVQPRLCCAVSFPASSQRGVFHSLCRAGGAPLGSGSSSWGVVAFCSRSGVLRWIFSVGGRGLRLAPAVVSIEVCGSRSKCGCGSCLFVRGNRKMGNVNADEATAVTAIVVGAEAGCAAVEMVSEATVNAGDASVNDNTVAGNENTIRAAHYPYRRQCWRQRWR